MTINTEKPLILMTNTPEISLKTPKRTFEDYDGLVEADPTLQVLPSGRRDGLMARVDQLRTEYVRSQGWLGPERTDDWDRYDLPEAATLNFVKTYQKSTENGSENDIEAYFRLTPVDSVEGSLSFNMLTPEVQATIDCLKLDYMELLAADGHVYDLTRLIRNPDRAISGKQFVESLIQLIGRGIYETAEGRSEPPIWIFTTTKAIHRVLDSMGILNDVLAVQPEPAGTRGGDTLFCVSSPLWALKNVTVTNRDKYQLSAVNVEYGIEQSRLRR